MKRIALSIIAALTMASCSHRPPPIHGQTLFPEGVYTHNVLLQIKDEAPYPLRGVLRYDKDSIKVFLLGPMDVTAATITDTFTSNTVAIETTFPKFKDREAYIRRVYDIFRAFVLYPKSSDSWGGLKVTKRHTDGTPEILEGPRAIVFKITAYKNGHPISFDVTHPHVTAHINESEDSEL